MYYIMCDVVRVSWSAVGCTRVSPGFALFRHTYHLSGPHKKKKKRRPHLQNPSPLRLPH